ncbi:hypothetical protein [Rubrobacter indicoceani]|uniref:hypothetical protein n=1 Tax=Rubrobacter indicoceani TaxID=2051957 RepID=UPI0013C4ED0F|nr:hypothetical protein [Rubrobacter indicoceani]
MVTVIASVIAAVAAVWSLIVQLRQASRRPRIVVTGVQIVHRESDREVVDTIREIKSERKEHEQYRRKEEAYERALKEWENRQQKRKGSSWEGYVAGSAFIEPKPLHPASLLYAGRLGSSLDHGGYFPNVIIRITLKNAGKVVAQNVGGTVYVQGSHIYPVYFPGLDVDDEERAFADEATKDDQGFYRAKLIPTSEDLLHNDEVVLRIGAIYRPRSKENTDQPKMKVKYSFITPSGFGYTDEKQVILPEPRGT